MLYNVGDVFYRIDKKVDYKSGSFFPKKITKVIGGIEWHRYEPPHNITYGVERCEVMGTKEVIAEGDDKWIEEVSDNEYLLNISSSGGGKIPYEEFYEYEVDNMKRFDTLEEAQREANLLNGQ